MASFMNSSCAKKQASLLMVFMVLTLSSACTIAPPAPPVQTQTFAHLPRLNWQAAPPKITYAPGLQRQANKLSNPVLIVANWVRDRLPYGGRFEAGASKNVSVAFTVLEASMEETRGIVPGVLFDTEQVSLQGVLKVRVEISTANGVLHNNMIDVRAALQREGAISLNELDSGRFLVIQRLSSDFDREMEAYLRQQSIIF